MTKRNEKCVYLIILEFQLKNSQSILLLYLFKYKSDPVIKWMKVSLFKISSEELMICVETDLGCQGVRGKVGYRNQPASKIQPA